MKKRMVCIVGFWLGAACAHQPELHSVKQTSSALKTKQGPTQDYRQAARAYGAPYFPQIKVQHRRITTSEPWAQRYFDQGLTLQYGFDYGDAVRAFRAATKADPYCAMCFFGLALALGSLNNSPLEGDEIRQAREASEKALALVDPHNAREAAFVKALAARYQKNSLTSHKATRSSEPPSCHKANGIAQAEKQAFADATHALWKQLPDDPDAAVLYVGAMFDAVAWDFAEKGKQKPYTPEVIAAAQAALRLEEHHLGAMHYYLHLMELTEQAEKALPQALALARLGEGVEHLVHMPAHTHMSLGDYHAASLANYQAIATFQKYQYDCRQQGFEPLVNYQYLHDLQFASATASFEGHSANAVAMARELVAQTKEYGVERDEALQWFLPTTIFALARFQRWQELLQEPSPAPRYPYTTAMWHYGRALALAALGKTQEAEQEQAAFLKQQKSAVVGQLGTSALNIKQMKVAAMVLDAQLAGLKHGKNAQHKLLRAAARYEEDEVGVGDPPRWYTPVRQMLGYSLLSEKQGPAAEEAFRSDLRRYPKNGWSLLGLAASLRLQGKLREAAEAERQGRQAWQFADAALPLS